MAFCRNCGNQLADQAAFCPNCGTAQNAAPAPVDKGGFWWGALGCCVPIVGLILFLVWKDTKPKTAKSAGKGALISVIAGAVLTVLYVVIMVVIGVVVGAASYY